MPPRQERRRRRRRRGGAPRGGTVAEDDLCIVPPHDPGGAAGDDRPACRGARAPPPPPPRPAARARRHGRVPAVLLSLAGAGPGEGVAHRKLLTADRKQLAEMLKQSPYFLSMPVVLQVRAGERSTAVVHSGTVLPIKVHRDETTGNILNLVMVQADEGTMLKVNLPVEFKGEDACPGLKKGGFLQKIRTSLLYLCPAEHIPPKIEVDLTNLDVGDRVLMHDIPVHSSLKLLSKNETMPICKILASKPVE